METVETNDTKGWIIGAIVLVVVIVGGWLIIKNNKTSSSVVGGTGSSMKESSETKSDNMPIVDDVSEGSVVTDTVVIANAKGETVSIKDQPAGVTASVDSMNLTAPSWVAIKDVKGVMGAAWFPVGMVSGAVSLLRPMIAGGSYQAVVYIDDGDKKFDMHKDTIVAGVGSSFVAK